MRFTVCYAEDIHNLIHKRLYHSAENMVDLVKSISLPHSNVAMLSDIGGSLYRIHSPDLVQRVRYYGTSETMTAFFKGLSREKCMPDESNDGKELEASSSQSVAPNLQDMELMKISLLLVPSSVESKMNLDLMHPKTAVMVAN